MNNQIKSFDDKRNLAIPGDVDETIEFCVSHFVHTAQKAIQEQGVFTVALSGGSTPKKIFQKLSENHQQSIDWKKVKLFWSDERSVAPTHPDSNFKMAMDSGFKKLPIPEHNIFRMEAERDIEEAAKNYEKTVHREIGGESFDLVMLGMGDDGHTASLFPKTHGLHSQDRWVIANFVPKLDTWRLSLTYECINASKEIVIYVLGANKSSMVKQVLLGKEDPDHLPIQKVGTPNHKALWVLDTAAASEIG